MALKEDDIKDLGLEIGEEVKPMSIGACSTMAEHGLPDCDTKCQACMTTCERRCQGWQ